MRDDCGDATDEDPTNCLDQGYLAYSFEDQSDPLGIFENDHDQPIPWVSGSGNDAGKGTLFH